VRQAHPSAATMGEIPHSLAHLIMLDCDRIPGAIVAECGRRPDPRSAIERGAVGDVFNSVEGGLGGVGIKGRSRRLRSSRSISASLAFRESVRIRFVWTWSTCDGLPDIAEYVNVMAHSTVVGGLYT